MIVFITTVLLLAALQSFGKFSLLPRRWEILQALCLAGLPFLFDERIAGTSMQALNAALFNAEILENWCALVVIQELFTLAAGFSLLDDLSRSDLPRRGPRHYLRYLKYLVFLPSLLLPAGVLYLQMYLFNVLPDIQFRTLTWLLAGGIPVLSVLIPELLRLLRTDLEERILLVLHAEYFLVLPAIFLPVAANAHLAPGGDDSFPVNSLLVLAGLAVFTGISGIGCKIFEIYKRNRRKTKKCQL